MKPEIEKVAAQMSNAVHDVPWEVLKEQSPLTAAAELRRAEAIMSGDTVRGLIRVGEQLAEHARGFFESDNELEAEHSVDGKKLVAAWEDALASLEEV